MTYNQHLKERSKAVENILMLTHLSTYAVLAPAMEFLIRAIKEIHLVPEVAGNSADEAGMGRTDGLGRNSMAA